MKNLCTAYLDFLKSLNELLKGSLQTFELQAVLFFHFRFVRRVLRTPSRRVCRVAQVKNSRPFLFEKKQLMQNFKENLAEK